MASLSCCCTTNAISTNASSNLRLFHHSKKLQFHNNSHSFGFLRFNETPLYSRVLTVVAVVKTRRENRIARHERIRKKVEGTTERPRLAVFKSNKHLYCQVIDDSKMHTLASASTIQKTLAEELNLTSGPTIEAAKKVGEVIAKACLEKGITKIAFDRGGFQYHGHIKALADSAREHGLVF